MKWNFLTLDYCKTNILSVRYYAETRPGFIIAHRLKTRLPVLRLDKLAVKIDSCFFFCLYHFIYRFTPYFTNAKNR
jgi:hypothetical protein